MTEALPRLLSRADLEGNHSYKIVYSGFRLQSKNACMSLKTLVGPAGLEPATPCLEGSFRPYSKMPYFQILTFQLDTGNLLKLVESC